MHIGVAHHFGWAVAVTADASGEVVDRRRIELVEPGVAVAPIHTDGADLDDGALGRLVDEVRASAQRATAESLDELEGSVARPVASVSLRWWDPDFPRDLHTLRKVPHEARADSVMYRQVLADDAARRGWAVHLFDAKDVEAAALAVLGATTDAPLRAPRAILGAPWGKDQRLAYAAALVAGAAMRS